MTSNHMFWWLSIILSILYFTALGLTKKMRAQRIANRPTPRWLDYAYKLSMIGIILTALLALKVDIFEPIPIFVMGVGMFIYKLRWNESVYRQMRASVGMSPAKSNDFGEAVAYLAMDELLSQHVIETSKTIPKEEQNLFLISYALYIKWILMHLVGSKISRDAWLVAEPLIDREYAKRTWYDSVAANNIWHAMAVNQPQGGAGMHTGVDAGPWPDIIVAVAVAGYRLSPDYSVTFLTQVKLLKQVIDQELAAIVNRTRLPKT